MTADSRYFVPPALLPPQTAMVSGHSVLTHLYAVIPSEVLADNVLCVLPEWTRTRCWIYTAPAMGHHASFSQSLVYVEDGGGSDEPEPERGVESFLFVLRGTARLTLAGTKHELADGGFAFVPPDAEWSLHGAGPEGAKLLWLRKAYQPYRGPRPAAIVGNERDLPVSRNPTAPNKFTTRLIPTEDVAYDFHMNIVGFQPGAIVSNAETHIMEHGLYMLEGKGVYMLNERWHEVQAGDYIWMRAFCPQAFYAGGPTPTRYLLYKDMNRQVSLTGDPREPRRP
jgi:(S)-ureidoglycine aminohydrolase